MSGGESGQGEPRNDGRRQQTSGRTDLLLRFFDSEFFNEWIAVQYLFTSKSEGVQDYICNRMYSLPEKGIEMYLSQMVTMVCERKKGSALERCIIDLCSRSLQLAVKVHWYLLAASEDRPNDLKLKELQKKCETAAIEGNWEAPLQLSYHEGNNGDNRSSHARGDNLHLGKEGELAMSQDSSTQTQNGPSSAGISSKRLRQGTYKATLELVSRLCACSTGIKEIPTILEQQTTLRNNLNSVNTWLAGLPAHSAVLLPLDSARPARVVRVPPSESALLNSRDKAPFMLCLEVIQEPEKGAGAGATTLSRVDTGWTPQLEEDKMVDAAEEFEHLKVAVQEKANGAHPRKEDVATKVVDKEVIDKM
eukprot:CAMPEP_0118940318 /NCGR_PEP_ID=MMETSP1169-20130426/31153_1 /TAXON_ID=36882 /ORGANISM="Pyramimonas obovata, Strain CCMP722" /LENGTH=362 /DNA_ID=CAMNT_0006884779 /DNA_START=160 /DNA_END=1245 /DNA_ORIENTATION=-